MDMGSNSGQMGQSMKVNGTIIKLKERAHFGMQKEMCTRENLRMTKLTAMEFTLMLMDRGMKGTGKMTCRKDMEVKFGAMELNTQETIKKERNTIMVLMNG